MRRFAGRIAPGRRVGSLIGVPQVMLFRVARNSGKRGTAVELLEEALEALRTALPSAWSVTPGVERPDRGVDLTIDIVTPDGIGVTLLVELADELMPRDVPKVAAQVGAVGAASASYGGAMVLAPFVSPTTRTQLDRHGLGWFDATGNLRLMLERPAVFIDRTGADRGGPRDPADRQLKSLRGPAAARMVLELCETPLPVGVRQLAQGADVGVASSARVLELLDREAVLERDAAGAVTAVRKRSLVRRWVVDYKLMTSNEVITALDPRGPAHALGALRGAAPMAVVTGSAAARTYLPADVTPVSPQVALTLYADDPVALMRELGLRAVDRGTNVFVLRPYDDVVHAKSRVVDGTRVAAPAQVVADLLTGPGRSTEEAEQLMGMLAEADPGWAT